MNQSSSLTQALARKQELKSAQAVVSLIVSHKHGTAIVVETITCVNLTDALRLANALTTHVDDELCYMEEDDDEAYADSQAAL